MIKSLVINQTLPSDHFCLLAHLHLSRPLPQKVYVQARNFMAIDMAVFNSDLLTRLALAPPFAADGLHQTLTDLLNQHAPASTRLVSHRPPSLWFSLVGPQLLEAKRERRRAERQWIKSGLTVHKLIFQTANSAVNVIVHSAKTAYYNSKILACSTSKQLHNITNSLLGKSATVEILILLPCRLVTIHNSLVSHMKHFILFLRLLSRTSSGNPVSKLVSLILSQLPYSVSVLTLFFPTLQLLLITLLCLAPSLCHSNLLS